MLTRVTFVLLVLAIISGGRWFVMLLTVASGVALSVTFIALSTMLRYKFYLGNIFLTSTPCNRRFGTHISTYYFILFLYVY